MKIILNGLNVTLAEVLTRLQEEGAPRFAVALSRSDYAKNPNERKPGNAVIVMTAAEFQKLEEEQRHTVEMVLAAQQLGAQVVFRS
ncbi:MAG: hypothetical protein Q8N65_02735 [bacterium]|nr:hypothetical protein [bacterium]